MRPRCFFPWLQSLHAANKQAALNDARRNFNSDYDIPSMVFHDAPRRTAQKPVITTRAYGAGVGGRRHHRWWYAWVPLFAAFIWLGTILSLLITWLASGRPRYVSMSPGQTIAYISDVAADILKPLFIAATSITSVGFVLSLITERWARHAGRYFTSIMYSVV